MQLYNIYYVDDAYGDYIDDRYGDSLQYIITTNNPAKWIKEYNQKGKIDGKHAEELDRMVVRECNLEIFENSNFKMLTGKEKPFKWTDR